MSIALFCLLEFVFSLYFGCHYLCGFNGSIKGVSVEQSA